MSITFIFNKNTSEIERNVTFNVHLYSSKPFTATAFPLILVSSYSTVVRARTYPPFIKGSNCTVNSSGTLILYFCGLLIL